MKEFDKALIQLTQVSTSDQARRVVGMYTGRDEEDEEVRQIRMQIVRTIGLEKIQNLEAKERLEKMQLEEVQKLSEMYTWKIMAEENSAQ